MCRRMVRGYGGWRSTGDGWHRVRADRVGSRSGDGFRLTKPGAKAGITWNLAVRDSVMHRNAVKGREWSRISSDNQ